LGVVVTVMNMKGGVGKTTVTAHLAGVTARYLIKGKERRVLVIDYDPQFNLSQAYLPAKSYFEAETAKKTILSVLIDDDDDLDPYRLQVPGNHEPPKLSSVVTNVFSGTKARLDIVLSTLDLMYAALGQATEDTRPIEERFAKFISECRENYDIIYIDCHPAGSLFTKTSLRNSDHVLIPVVPQRYAVRGIGLMTQFISAKAVGGVPPKAHILFNSAPRSSISREEAEIRADSAYTPLCLTATLKKYKVFAEPEGGRGFVWASGKPYSTEAFRNLLRVAEEFIGRVGA